MMKIADHIKQSMATKLFPGETLSSVGKLHSGPLLAYGLLRALKRKFGVLVPMPYTTWYGGVTEKRLILLPLDGPNGEPQQNEMRSVPLESVRVNGDRIAFQPDGMEKAEELRVMSLSQFMTGLDAAEFLAAIRK